MTTIQISSSFSRGSLRIRKDWRALTQICLLAALILTMSSISSASAVNIYIAQTSTGAANGADCGDAYPYTFFNNSNNWGGASTQIGPGTTVHVCGTISANPGTVGLLTFQGSGASGNPITLKFESGAILTASYWGRGAIAATNLNYLTVDGGTNGIIQSTGNGTNLGSQQDYAWGVGFLGVSYSEVKNLNISNMYVHTCNYPLSNCNDTVTNATAGIYWQGGSYDKIDHNTVHDAKACIQFLGNGNTSYSNWEINNNIAYNCNWAIQMGDSGDAMIMNPPVLIHDNEGHDAWNWDTASDAYHHNCIFIWENGAHSQFNQPYIYNNYCHGDWGLTQTSLLYIAGGSGTNPLGTIVNAKVFNNVFSDDASDVTHRADDGNIFDWGYQSSYYNNTVTGNCSNTNDCGTGIAIYGQGVTLRNNIIQNFTNAIGSNENGATAISSSNGNVFYQFQSLADLNNSYYNNLSNWQGCSSCTATGSPDGGGQSANPLLSAVFQLVSNASAAWQNGINLTSLGITALDSDKMGTPRPSSGPWSAGAYQGGSNANQPAPPTGVIATVN